LESTEGSRWSLGIERRKSNEISKNVQQMLQIRLKSEKLKGYTSTDKVLPVCVQDSDSYGVPFRVNSTIGNGGE
jgi:hypothetical protein